MQKSQRCFGDGGRKLHTTNRTIGFSQAFARESIDEIEVHVRYVGAQKGRISATGEVLKGQGVGTGVEHLWDGERSFSSSAGEQHFVITRDAGSAQTTVTIRPTGRPSISLVSKRADAILTTTYVGVQDSPQPVARRVSVTTPNNNENRGNCPNQVGYHDGKYCTSRTPIQLTTSPPHFFKTARMDCSGFGCPWGFASPVTISADGLKAEGYVENWGSSFVITMIADEYEHLSASQCGAEASVPVMKDKPVIIGVRKECVSLAKVRWTALPGLSEGLFMFGKSSPNGEVAMNGTLLDSDAAAFASYSFKK